MSRLTRLPSLALLLVAVAHPAAGQREPRPRAVEAAVQAQRAFESYRRARAPERLGGSGPCEERIGRFCYWDNNGEVTPREPEEIGERRRALLDDLGRTARAAPADDWVAGQLVRYLVEDRLFLEAATAARDCGGTPWWCRALLGLALHEGGDHAGAAAAYDAALALMPPEQRCRWSDASVWMTFGHDAYRALGCSAARDSASRHFFWLARPLWMLPGDDARAELLSRRTMSRILAGAAQGHQGTWGADLEQLTLRYGWPVAWSRHRAGLDPSSAVGHEPAPSYDVTPAGRALERPLEAREEDWEPRRRRPRMRYAPRYARRAGAFAPVEHQLVFFPRGDSVLVGLVWDLGADSSWTRGDVHVGLVLAASATREVARVVREGAPARGVLLRRVAAEPAVASVEAWSPRRSFAARSRYAVRPPPRDARLSSLAVLRRAPPDTAGSAEEVLAAALGTGWTRAGETIHLYWETYGASSAEGPHRVSLSMTRVGAGLLERAAARVRLAPRAAPVTMAWGDAGHPRGGYGRTLALRVPALPAGAYRIEVAAGGDTTAATVRVLPPDAR